MNYRNLRRAWLIILLSAWLVACSSSGSGSDSDGDGGAVISLKDLDGTWETDCLVDAPFSVSLVVTFNNGNADLSETEYADGACTMVMTVNSRDLLFELGSAVMLDGAVAGITSATQADVTITTPMIAETGNVDYDIIAIKGNSLYIGDSNGANDGSTLALRPTQLDAEYVFTKQ